MFKFLTKILKFLNPRRLNRRSLFERYVNALDLKEENDGVISAKAKKNISDNDGNNNFQKMFLKI